jgi:hypothetical protein
MSGGHFDYVQYRISQVADEVAQEILNNNVKDDWGHSHDYSEETLEKFRLCVKLLKETHIMLQRIDYLISGDDSEETFHKRWMEDLENLKKEVL